jgi:hypothetical protein
MCDKNIVYDSAINLTVGDVSHRYAIRGIIYLTNHHFTSRLVKPNGALWYHDGILTGSSCEPDGFPQNFLNTCNIEGLLVKQWEYFMLELIDILVAARTCGLPVPNLPHRRHDQ